MKLLLTSSGFTNKSIATALLSLTEKPFKELKLAFIPTAANVEEGDKGWLIDDMVNAKNLGFAEIDVVDISALPKDIWLKKLKDADILMFGGGNTFYLMYWIEKSGLKRELPKLLKTRVYVGVSAGSMVTAKNFNLSQSQRLYYEDIGKYKNNEGLGYVNFHIQPHLNSPDFPKVRIKHLQQIAKSIPEPIYAIDDQTAIKYEEGKVEVVSEGKWKRFN